MKQKIMIISGEASGDLHGSGLVRALKKNNADLEFFGIGGDKMKGEGVDLFYHISEMSVLGFGDVIKRFPFFRKVYKQLVEYLKTRKPDLLILIDYPGLNLKLARVAKKLGIKVFYYIAPQVWAWGADRIKKMKELVDRLGVIIPFEEQMFMNAGIDTEYVGHPLLEVLRTKMNKDEFFKVNQLNSSKKVVGLLPGSRLLEVKRLLPEMLNSVKFLEDTHVVISKAATVEHSIYEEILNGNSSLKLLEDSTSEIMKYSDLLLVASGTATLESALFETPLIIVYRVDPLSYFIGKQLVKIKNIGLVNVIAEKRIIPEYIQYDFKAKNLEPTMKKLLYDSQERQKIIISLKNIKEKLGKKVASENAASIALSMLNS